jgi:hypothetical protein
MARVYIRLEGTLPLMKGKCSGLAKLPGPSGSCTRQENQLRNTRFYFMFWLNVRSICQTFDPDCSVTIRVAIPECLSYVQLTIYQKVQPTRLVCMSDRMLNVRFVYQTFAETLTVHQTFNKSRPNVQQMTKLCKSNTFLSLYFWAYKYLAPFGLFPPSFV